MKALQLVLILMLTACGKPYETVAERYKCTNEHMVSIKQYVDTCSQKDSYFASYCFDKAIENFCTLRKVKK
jgi:hypothetical protein